MTSNPSLRRLLSFLLIFYIQTRSCHCKALSHTDLSWANYMMQKEFQRALTTDPATSATCFGLYLPRLEEAANQWSLDYNNCINSANRQRDSTLAAMRDGFQDLSSAATDVSQYIAKCQMIKDAMPFLQCFGDLSKNVMSTISSIAYNASNDARDLLKQLDAIDIDMYQCTNTSERLYTQETSHIVNELDDCLQNGPHAISPTTPAPTTTSAGTTLEDTTSVETTSEGTASESTTSESTPSQETTPYDSSSQESASEEDSSEESDNEETPLKKSTPVDTTTLVTEEPEADVVRHSGRDIPKLQTASSSTNSNGGSKTSSLKEIISRIKDKKLHV